MISRTVRLFFGTWPKFAPSETEALDGSWIDKLQELLDDTADALQKI